MPLKILHANAKAFEETERNTRAADGSIQKSMNQPHPLAAYRQFWCVGHLGAEKTHCLTQALVRWIQTMTAVLSLTCASRAFDD